jgi:hypothetical protein
MNKTNSSGILRYHFSELGVTSSKIEKIMGFDPGSTPDTIHEIVVSVLDEAPEISDIQGGYEMILQFKIENNSIVIDDLTFLTGKLVTQFIKHSEILAFFIFTAGKEIEAREKKCFKGNDPMRGYVYDVLGSETVEAAIEKMMDDLEQEMLRQELKITNPYSPGYCGWPIQDQFTLFSFFPDKYCGITLSETALMHPVKSLSGVIGIGPNVKKQPYSCQICDAQNCIYRDKR